MTIAYPCADGRAKLGTDGVERGQILRIVTCYKGNYDDRAVSYIEKRDTMLYWTGGEGDGFVPLDIVAGIEPGWAGRLLGLRGISPFGEIEPPYPQEGTRVLEPSAAKS